MAPYVVAASVSAVWCGAAIWLGPRLGFVDHPERSELTAHRRPAIPLGGVGIYLGVVSTSVLTDDWSASLVAASTVILALGLVDDRFGLSPISRLIVQGIAAMIVVAGLGADLWFSIFGVILIVVCVNAVNLYDGLDGLAGLSAAISALGLALLSPNRGLTAESSLILSAALAGFLVFNWHPARVFLGNSGAYLVGLLLARQILEVSAPSVAETLVVSATIGVFLIDLIVSIIRRIMARGQLFTGDRDHIYDQLRSRGGSVPAVALTSAAAQAAIVVLVVILDRAVAIPATLLILTSLLIVVVALLGRAGFIIPRST